MWKTVKPAAVEFVKMASRCLFAAADGIPVHCLLNPKTHMPPTSRPTRWVFISNNGYHSTICMMSYSMSVRNVRITWSRAGTYILHMHVEQYRILSLEKLLECFYTIVWIKWEFNSWNLDRLPLTGSRILLLVCQLFIYFWAFEKGAVYKNGCNS